MSDPMYFGGTPLSEAITELHVETSRQIIAAAFKARINRHDRDDLMRVRPLLWKWIVERVVAGELVVSGRMPGSKCAAEIDLECVEDATPDFEANVLIVGDFQIRNVRIRKAAHGFLETSQASRSAGRLDYRVADAGLVAEMKDLIAAGRAKGPMDAADQVSSRAAGTGKPGSKVARLLKRFNDDSA